MDEKAIYRKLLSDLKRHYKTHGRSHLPWRATTDPYRILVSELMLQQTQVERVVPYYERWIKAYPTARKLSEATLSDVLALWQGLGYNRRAKYLHEAAKLLRSAETLRSGEIYLAPARRVSAPQFMQLKLPGVGPYTRGAVLAFAFNKPEVFIETNIRTVFFQHLNDGRVRSDAQLIPMVAEALRRSRMEPRDFYAAMMDYGSYLKRQGVRLNSRSKHYAKQSKFEGSARELRGAILRELLRAPQTRAQLTKHLSRNKGEVEAQLRRLAQEGLVTAARGRYRIAG